jgi:hypothetical protein
MIELTVKDVLRWAASQGADNAAPWLALSLLGALEQGERFRTGIETGIRDWLAANPE